MKPNFSLSLSFDGIRLLYRGKPGWREIGSVSLEDDDLSGSLASLRAKALESAPQGLRSKLIIPNEQIKYLALPGKGLKDTDIRAALEGATPYEVAELSYDFAEQEDGTAVAAVANETLEEAEAFAAEHDFGPVSFVAVPEAGDFPGEPFFGKAKAAADLKVSRDKKAVPLATIPTSLTSAEDAPGAPQEQGTKAEDAPVPEDQAEPAVVADDARPGAQNTPDISDEAAEAQVAEAPDTSEEARPSSEAPAEPEAAPSEPAEEETGAASPDAPEQAEPERAHPEQADEPDGSGIGAARDDGHFEDNAATADEAPEEPDAIAAVADEGPSDNPSDDDAAAIEPQPEAPAEAEAEPVAASAPPSPEPPPAEPVFSSRLRSVRQELDLPPQPAVRRPNGSVSPGQADGAVSPLAAAARGAEPQAEPRTPMPPAVAEALKKVESRETVPPRVGSPSAGREETVGEIGSPAFRPATPPPPAVSKALERVRNSPDLPPINGSAPPRPIPGAGPQARVTSAPPSLPSAPSRSELPPPVRQTQKSVPTSSENAIPAPPAEVAASLSASVGPAGAPSEAEKTSKRRFSLPGGRRAKDQASVMRTPATEAETEGTRPEAIRSQSEKERLTVFGARRKQEEIGGKPRFLGLILTAILLLLMAAVAAWATISTDSFARFFGLSDPTEIAADESGAQTPALAASPPQATVTPEPAFEPTPLPASESPFGSGTIPTGAMLMSETGSLLPDPDLLRALSAPTPAQAVADVPGAVLSPAAAERFYAATGVWLRAPRLPVEPQPEPLGAVARIVADTPPQTGGTPRLPQAAPDPVLSAQLDPPPPDMRFERDERGLLLATPEGTITPDGLVIYAGSPSIVPPTRPGTPPVIPEPQAADPETAVIAEPAAPAEEAPAAPEAPTELAAAPEPSAEPVIAEATESLASEALAVLEEVPVRPDARISTAGTLNAAAITLNGIRPAVRPEDAVPEALLPEVELASFEGPRPPQRPEGLAPEAERSEAVEEEAAPADDVQSALAGILEGAADPLATATTNAVASAIRPDSRPNNFDRVVQQARARQSLASAPAASAPTSGSQPEAVSNAAAQPTGPVPQTVASAATVENAINLRQINLIGVYGRPSDRRALVRLSNGRYVRVGVGDRLDGGRVAAINDNTLNYVKSGRTVTLEIPSG